MQINPEDMIAAREAAGHTQMKAATAMEISLNTLSNLEVHGVLPNVHIQRTMANYIKKNLKK